MFEVEIGGGDEGVDPRFGRRLDRLPHLVDVAWMGAGETGDGGTVFGADLDCDLAHRLEIIRAGRRESGFDDIDPEASELPCDLELFAAGEAGAR